MKKVPITLIVELEMEFVDDADDDFIRFHAEENHCVTNHIERLHAEVKDGVCVHCARSDVLVGHRRLELLKGIGR